MEYPKRTHDKTQWITDCVGEYTEQFEDKTQKLCERCYDRGIKFLYPSVDELINFLNSK